MCLYSSSADENDSEMPWIVGDTVDGFFAARHERFLSSRFLLFEFGESSEEFIRPLNR